MPLGLGIPARINSLGHPANGWEGDCATISAAVNVFAGAHFEAANDLVIQRLSGRSSDGKIIHQESFPKNTIPLPYTGSLNLVKGAVNHLYTYSEEFRCATWIRNQRALECKV